MEIKNKNIYNDYCYECKINGDDGYYDKEKKEYIKLCNECAFNDKEGDDENESSV